MAKLNVKIGKLELKNPVMTASGTFGYGVEFADFVEQTDKSKVAVQQSIDALMTLKAKLM